MSTPVAEALRIRDIGKGIVDRLLDIEQRVSLLYAEAAFEKARADIAESKLRAARTRIEELEAQHRQRMANVVPLRPVRELV